jgi:hypothetical protein
VPGDLLGEFAELPGRSWQTSLVDPEAYPARDLANLYLSGWQIEVNLVPGRKIFCAIGKRSTKYSMPSWSTNGPSVRVGRTSNWRHHLGEVQVELAADAGPTSVFAPMSVSDDSPWPGIQRIIG